MLEFLMNSSRLHICVLRMQGCISVCMYVCTDGRIDGWIDCVQVCIDVWMYECVCASVCVCVFASEGEIEEREGGREEK